LAAVIVPLNKHRAAERLFHEARVEPRWIGPPAAEQIRERDDEKLVEALRAQAADVSDDDRALAKKVLEGADPEALVATLVRAQREALPAPEDVTPWTPQPKKAPVQGVWFRVNVGHKQRADPKWLVPMLCRRGEIDKADIGAFRIFAEETRVLVSQAVAERFLDHASRPDRQDPRVRIALATEDQALEPRKPRFKGKRK
jgi:ATP-dependent RNA helicase DeaD